LAPSIALATGYNSPLQYRQPTYQSGPHGGYAITTDKCKDCHAIHQATGTYVLLRNNSAAEVCDACHATGGLSSLIVSPNAEGHDCDGTTETAPDDSDTAFYTNSYTCLICHSVHGANLAWITRNRDGKTVQGSRTFPTNYAILKGDPDTADSVFDTTGTLTEWCADCHSANYGPYNQAKILNGTTVYSHSCIGTGPHAPSGIAVTTEPNCASTCHKPGGLVEHDVCYLDTTNEGPTCHQCHCSNSGSGVWPHQQGGGTSRDLLKNTFGPTGLDGVCLDCHHQDLLP